MIIQRNPELERLFLERIVASFDEPLPEMMLVAEPVRTGIHLSDLMNVRQSYWKRALPMSVEPQTAQLFMYGRGFEVEVVRRSGLIPAVSKVKHGISYRPDFGEWPGVFVGPIELKWRRANLAADGEEADQYDNYIEQIRGYCALGETPHAKLIVNTPRQGQSAQNYKAQTQPATRIYDLEFTSEELAQTEQELLSRATAFANAIADGAKSATLGNALPLCREWLCGSPKLNTSAHCVECDKDLVGTWADKHTSTKAGAGHTVVAPTWTYEARCSWYVFCRPQLTDPARGDR